jgi:SAM-dependent methyltransferase
MDEFQPDWSRARALNNLQSHRVLKQQLDTYATDPKLVVDIGCGTNPYRHYIASKNYVGIDVISGDVRGDAMCLPVKNTVADVVLSSQVLEHLPYPRKFFSEVSRVLKPNGVIILTTPMIWPLHDEPRDFWRFTPHSLALLADEVGLEVIFSGQTGGFISAAWQMVALILERPTYHQGWGRKIYRYGLQGFFCLVNPLVDWIDTHKTSAGLTISVMLVARKP